MQQYHHLTNIGLADIARRQRLYECRDSNCWYRHSGAERSEEPGIDNPSAGTMDSRFAASRRPGMTGYG